MLLNFNSDLDGLGVFVCVYTEKLRIEVGAYSSSELMEHLLFDNNYKSLLILWYIKWVCNHQEKKCRLCMKWFLVFKFFVSGIYQFSGNLCLRKNMQFYIFFKSEFGCTGYVCLNVYIVN